MRGPEEKGYEDTFPVPEDMAGLTPAVAAEITTRFTYHAPSAEQIPLYQEIRSFGRDFAVYVLQHVPDSRERSLALTHMEQAVMWANAAVARRS